MCVITVEGRQLLVSAGADGTVRIWDPGTGEQLRSLLGHSDWVNAVCAVTVDDRQLLASAADDGTVRVWDPGTGQQFRIMNAYSDWVNGVRAVTVNGLQLLVCLVADRTVRVWHPGTGHCITSIPVPYHVSATAQVRPNNLVVAGSGFMLALELNPSTAS